MLEPIEMKFIITTEEGKMIAGYSDYESAELDAKDLSSSEEQKDKKFHIYELTNATKLGETILQKTYELKITLPLPPEETPEEKSDESKPAETPADEKPEKSEGEAKKETKKSK